MTGHLRDLSSDLSSCVFWELEVLISGPSWYVFFLKETGSLHRHNNLKRVCLGTVDGTLSSRLWGRAVQGREQAILAFQRGLYLPPACGGVWELSVQHRHWGAWWAGRDFLCRRNCAGSKPVCLRVPGSGVGMPLLLPVSLKPSYLLVYSMFPKSQETKRSTWQKVSRGVLLLFILYLKKCQHDGSSVSLRVVVGTYLDDLCFLPLLKFMWESF